MNTKISKSILGGIIGTMIMTIIMIGLAIYFWLTSKQKQVPAFVGVRTTGNAALASPTNNRVLKKDIPFKAQHTFCDYPATKPSAGTPQTAKI